MERVLPVALALFIASNIDTLIVLVAFLIDEDYDPIEVFVGHSIGSLVGIVAAIVVTAAAIGWLRGWTFLLGFVPLGLGLWGLRQPAAEAGRDEMQFGAGPTGRIGVVTMTAIGLNGENLAVYVPFFATLAPGELTVVLGIYISAIVALFLVAMWIAQYTVERDVPSWVDRRLVPIVLIIVGTYVLVSGWVVG